MSISPTEALRAPSDAPKAAIPPMRRVDVLVLASGLLLTAILVWVSFQPLSNMALGGVLLGLMMTLLMLNVNIGVAMAVPGLLGIWQIVGIKGLINMATEVPFGQTASFTLSVLPMFVVMGLLLWRSGITSDLYRAAQAWIGWVPGGLAVTTNLAGAGLGAASGSTMGITFAVGRIGIPEMLRAGYDKRLVVGSVASAGTIGQLIPPSLLLVVYANFAEVPVGPQLIAGIIPGILLTLGYIIMIVAVVLIWPKLAPRRRGADSVSWRERWTSLASIWPLIALIAIVIGGMAVGFFTPTEAGAVGAALAVILMFWRLKPREVWPAMGKALRDTVSSVGVLMFLLLGAALLNRMLALTGIARALAELVDGSVLGPVGFILALVVLFVVLGTFMEPLPMILIMVPILLPVVMEMGYSAIWFGIFMVLMGEIGLLSPPVGMLVFLVHRIAQDPEVNLGTRISLWDVFKGALWFVPVAIGIALLLAAFPGLVDWLPAVMQGN